MIRILKKTMSASVVFLTLASGVTSVSHAADDGSAAPSGEYTPDSEHAYITFDYLHQGYSRPVLRWGAWDATLDWNAEDPTASSITVTINASSIDSGVDRFDDHLRGEQFFDVANHPEITFKSTSLTAADDTSGAMTGELTIKGNTKPVTLDVTLNRAAFDARSNLHKMGFSATGVVKRSDFGVDAYTPFVSDEVNLNIQVEFTKPGE